MPRRGLPDTIAMRHDQHYVEALAASAGTPVGRLVPIDRIANNSHIHAIRGQFVPKTSTLPGVFRALFWISPWQRLSLVPALLKHHLNPALILL